jgi:YD repeat-containing protein
MVDPVQFLGRKLANAAFDAVVSKVKKARRERKKAPDLQHVQFERITTLTGHLNGPGRYQGKAIYDIDVSPSADALVTGGADGTVRIWPLDGSTGRIIFSLPSGNSVRTVAFAADGRLAVGGDDKRITVTEPVRLGEEARIASAVTYGHAIDRVTWSADGVRVVAFTRGGHVVLHTTAAEGSLEVLIRSRFADSGSNPCIRFTPDERAIARNIYDAVAAVTLSGEPVSQVRVPRLKLGGFDFSSDGTAMAVGVEDGTIRVLDWPGGGTLHILRSHDPTPLGANIPAVFFSPDGDLLATGGYDGMVKVWRSNDGALLGTQPFQAGSIHALTWIGDGRLAVVGDRGGQVWSVVV